MSRCAALPAFRGLTGDAAASLGGRVHVGPGIDYLERAFDASKYGEISAGAVSRHRVPVGRTIRRWRRPAGTSCRCTCNTRRSSCAAGSWGGQERALADAMLAHARTYAPGSTALVEHRQVITPLDPRAGVYGLTGGHIHHGELALDQLFTMRPTLGWADYRTPIAGLYLCGSGTHPGNGLTGASGQNAAREVLKSTSTAETRRKISGSC